MVRCDLLLLYFWCILFEARGDQRLVADERGHGHQAAPGVPPPAGAPGSTQQQPHTGHQPAVGHPKQQPASQTLTYEMHQSVVQLLTVHLETLKLLP